MTAKPASFTVHKNRVEKRQRRDRSRVMENEAKKMGLDNDLAAYVIVGVTKTGDALCSWDTGASIPMWALPGMVYRILDHDLSASGIKEDFCAPMKDK